MDSMRELSESARVAKAVEVISGFLCSGCESCRRGEPGKAQRERCRQSQDPRAVEVLFSDEARGRLLRFAVLGSLLR
jgi:hypothetical protein